MKNPKILFIAYYFPPIGGGGVQRSVRFCKDLPKFGWEPIVLTATPPEFSRWAPEDNVLFDRLPSNLEVHRTPPSNLPIEMSRSYQRICTILNIKPRFWREWKRQLHQKAREILNNHPDIAVIYTSLSPFEAASVAADLSNEFKIPWVADLRDPWALDEMLVFASGLHRHLAVREMKKTLSNANRIIMNTPVAKELAMRLLPDKFARISVITNGFDRDQFSNIKPRASEKFTILHTGTFHSELGLTLSKRKWIHRSLGRTLGDVDFRTRSPYYFVQALKLWFTNRPEAKQNVIFRVTGKQAPHDIQILHDEQLKGNVEDLGYVSHRESIQLQVHADLLFLPMHRMPKGHRASIVPGKTYEYLAAGKPILAAVPDGDAKDFVSKSPAASICEPDDVSGMVGVLEKSYILWLSGRTSWPQHSPDIDSFESFSLASKLDSELKAALKG